jgi:hypothetical protein
MPLEPARDQLEIFVEAIFRHATPQGFAAIRSFLEGEDKVFRISSAAMSGGLRFLIDVAEDDARRAAQNPKPVVFAPPLATFNVKDRAREQDIAEGLALSVECDQHPQEARTILETLIGPATLVVKSGGHIANGGSEPIDKLHLHWRLAKPARGGDLAKLKQARDIAARLVGGDPSNKPVCHPIRWPGSWHRKSVPRLCEIAAADPDREIDLGSALAALKAAFPTVNGAASMPPAGHDAGDREGWPELVAAIINGQSFHQPLVALAARLVGSGMHDGTAVKLLRGLMLASTGEHDALRWQARYDGIPRIVSSAREKYADAVKPKPAAPARPLLWPYTARAFSEIPRRRWLHAGHYVRQQIVMTSAPGGTGKTTLLLCNAIEMATGRGLIGPPPAEPLHVAYWNGEDPDDEIERRIAAACLHHDIDPASLHGHLFLGSRLTDNRRIASIDRDGKLVFDSSMLGEIERLIVELRLDCLVFDPLIAFHRIPEADNALMEQVIKDGFGEIATRHDVCIELSQHTRKGGQGKQGDFTADDSRGASAIINAARSVRILNRMTVEEAELPKISPEDRRHYLRVLRDKTNLAPPGKATWLRLVAVQLPNGDGVRPGDSVQTVVAWDYPQPFDGVTADDMRWARETAQQGHYRYDPRSPEWFGRALAERLGRDPDDVGDRKRLNAVLRAWVGNGALAIESRRDDARHERQYIVPGKWTEDTPGEGD